MKECVERYRLLFDTVPCYITVQDRDFRIVANNRLFEEDFGDQQGRKCYEAYKGRDEVCETCPVARAFEDGRVHQSEEIVTAADGRSTFVLVHAAPIADEKGEIHQVMEVSTNVTELKELQSRMAAVGRLVSRLAHTVKGIVMSLEGGMYVVNAGFEKSEEQVIRQGWDIVQRNIGRVSTLVLDMLQYAKDREPEFAPVEIGGLIREVMDLFETKFLKNRITMNVALGPVPPIRADEQRLHSMMVSLIENAIDACRWDVDQEEHVLAISVRETADGRVALGVADDGIGMDQETKDRLFTPMFSTKRGGGTGLGLLVAKKVATEHGGSIEVMSAPRAGTTFTVFLPVEGPPPPEVPEDEEGIEQILSA